MLSFADFEVLTFDCYGTLIDGESRIWKALDKRRHNKEGFGATPLALAHPDLQVPDFQTLADRMGLI